MINDYPKKLFNKAALFCGSLPRNPSLFYQLRSMIASKSSFINGHGRKVLNIKFQ